MADTKIYHIWSDMKNRCLNANCKEYRFYGERGISVFPVWVHDFQSFYEYVSQLEHYGEKGYTLDRINVNGNYEPDNLRWADRKTQARNKRNSEYIEYRGEIILVTVAAEKSGINYTTLMWRIKHGKRGEELFKPARNYKRN